MNPEPITSIALKIRHGRVSVNGHVYSWDESRGKIVQEVLENGEVRITVVGDHVDLEEGARTRPLGDAVYLLYPAEGRVLRGSPYAEVRGEHAARMILHASTEAEQAKAGKEPPNPPVSYLHCYSEGCFPYLELQVNEGCVRVATW